MVANETLRLKIGLRLLTGGDSETDLSCVKSPTSKEWLPNANEMGKSGVNTILPIAIGISARLVAIGL